MRPYRRLTIRAIFATILVIFQFGVISPPGAAPGALVPVALADPTTCSLGGGIQHVIYIQFDNTHFTRDNPNVPSDLEQMPHLLSFLKSNGTIITHHHTPLISHTATDILTSLTGVYGDKHGVPVSNSFRYFNPDGSTNLGVSFAYWTDPIFDPTTSSATDTTFNMLTAQGKNAPAPWAPFTRAGCNVGAVATANIVLENIGTDIPTVFGADSSQAAEVKANAAQATADFEGIGIHCAQASTLCSTANGGKPDLLPQEPGGYTGYMGLFGHKYVAPQINPGGPLTDLNGNTIQDSKGNVGFPGFDGMSPAVSLSYVAAMQEHGVPVTYAYISDAHDNHAIGQAMGPGQAQYEAQLKAYDDGFAKFFTRLQSDGITTANSLFVVTSDEGDHFVGGSPSPTNCDGVTTPCTYSKIGEINGNLSGLIADETGITTPFKVHADDAPTFYITGNPAPASQTARNLERAAGSITALNPLTGGTEQIDNYLADPVEERLLHMVTADPARTPTFTMFAKPDYYLFTGPSCTPAASCITEQPGFAWNHGDTNADIVTTWLGMAGPGVQNLGIDNTTWSDHTDIRPTVMALTGLKDDYAHDGRVLYEDLAPTVQPAGVQGHMTAYLSLAKVYKQLDASVGQFAMSTLEISTRALMSGNATTDGTYTALENRLTSYGNQRDALVGSMNGLLEGAEFGGGTFDDNAARILANQGWDLLNQVTSQASGYTFEVSWRNPTPGLGVVLFGAGAGCSSLVNVATADRTPGGNSHDVVVTGNDLAGTVGNIGIQPGTTYWYETGVSTPNGFVLDNNGGQCTSITVPGP
jgi:hypothetical protein